MSIEYALLQDAARAALVEARADSRDCHEYAGVIVVDHATGRFYFTDPQRGQESSVRIRVSFAAGDHLAALYHTHPACNALPADAAFSAGDMDIAFRLKVPSFIWVGFDDSLRRYDPTRWATTAAKGSIFTGS